MYSGTFRMEDHGRPFGGRRAWCCGEGLHRGSAGGLLASPWILRTTIASQPAGKVQFTLVSHDLDADAMAVFRISYSCVRHLYYGRDINIAISTQACNVYRFLLALNFLFSIFTLYWQGYDLYEFMECATNILVCFFNSNEMSSCSDLYNVPNF
ncbi:hypothetical protein SEVIR_9G092867v4 [Setaria viridis]